MITRTTTRVFQGHATSKVDLFGAPADQAAWYFEPTDHTATSLWSEAYPTEADARAAAASWTVAYQMILESPALSDAGTAEARRRLAWTQASIATADNAYRRSALQMRRT